MNHSNSSGRSSSARSLFSAPVFVLITACLIGLDQWSKFMAGKYLMNRRPFSIIDGVFELRYIENRGAAFGIMQGARPFFFVLTVLVMALIVVTLRRMPGERRFLPMAVCFTVLFSGALGNLIDRALRGYVIDFFYFRLIDFPVFNVADIYVTVSVACIMLLLFFYYRDDEFDRIFRFGGKKGGKA